MTPGTLFIPRGLPASGKTSWAREMLDRQPPGSIIRLNRDDLRAMMLPAGYGQPVHEAEEVVSLVQHGPIGELLRRGCDVVVDDTNLRARHVKRLAAIAAKEGAGWECVDTFLDVPVDVCITRDAARERPVGEVVIRGMHDRFLSGGRRPPVPVLDEVVTGKPYTAAVPGTPRSIIVDIDGTVAIHGARSPYDTSRYHEDTPNAPVVAQVHMAWSCGYAVVFCSGRDAAFRQVTQEWITQHVGVTGELFMRPEGDVRNDAVVKLELFDEHIRDRYDVAWVLDDRDRVVAAWRSIGLPVMQVAPGNF